MYNHLTNEELLRVTPASKLEAELIQRLDCCLECLAQQDESENELEKVRFELTDSNRVLEILQNAISTIATEIHRCADEGEININDDFIANCRNFIDDVYQYVHYPYPQTADALATDVTQKTSEQIYTERAELIQKLVEHGWPSSGHTDLTNEQLRDALQEVLHAG